MAKKTKVENETTSEGVLIENAKINVVTKPTYTATDIRYNQQTRKFNVITVEYTDDNVVKVEEIDNNPNVAMWHVNKHFSKKVTGNK